MEISFKQQKNLAKEKQYDFFIKQLNTLIKDENDVISILANTSAALHETFEFFWVGFYVVKDKELRLGPFQGNVACTHIKYGHGVCGSAWAKKETLLVPDVEQFPGHIACSSLSRSEIVIPLFVNNKVYAVLDIDSKEKNAFDNIDKKYLENICNILESTLNEIHKQKQMCEII